MDDNVMRKYTILPTEASHHLMYDQGMYNLRQSVLMNKMSRFTLLINVSMSTL